MEQSGEAPEPEQRAAQPSSPLPPPTSPPVSVGLGPPDDGPERRGFLVAGVLALVLVVGAVAWMARPDDGLAEVGRREERFPTPTTAADDRRRTVPTADRPCRSPSRRHRQPAPAPTACARRRRRCRQRPPGSAGVRRLRRATAPSRCPPTRCRYIARLVPSLAGFAEFLSTPELARAQVDQMLASGRHDVAVAGPVTSICAVVADGPTARRAWPLGARRPAHHGDRPRTARRPGLRRVPDRRRRRPRRGCVPVHRGRLQRRRVGGRQHRRRRRRASTSASATTARPTSAPSASPPASAATSRSTSSTPPRSCPAPRSRSPSPPSSRTSRRSAATTWCWPPSRSSRTPTPSSRWPRSRGPSPADRRRRTRPQ